MKDKKENLFYNLNSKLYHTVTSVYNQYANNYKTDVQKLE